MLNMLKHAKSIIIALIPVLTILITGMFYMWRDQAVQSEKMSSGFALLRQSILAHNKVIDLKFNLLDNNLKQLNKNINEHEKEDRQIIGLLLDDINKLNR